MGRRLTIADARALLRGTRGRDIPSAGRNKIIVIQFVTLDGVVEDPDGSGGTPGGGWCYRVGLEAIGGDKFHLGAVLDTGALLFGRKRACVQRWPPRTDDVATKMNRATKYVASRTLDSIDAWSNSHLLDGELVPAVETHEPSATSW